jgi:hypothetical protein
MVLDAELFAIHRAHATCHQGWVSEGGVNPNSDRFKVCSAAFIQLIRTLIPHNYLGDTEADAGEGT